MSWEHTLPLTIINGTNTLIQITLHHKQGNKGKEAWTESLASGTSSNNLKETSYSNHGDSWWAECKFDNRDVSVSCSEHHWGVQESYTAIVCTVDQSGFQMAGNKKGGGVSHHFFSWN